MSSSSFSGGQDWDAWRSEAKVWDVVWWDAIAEGDKVFEVATG